MSAYTIIGADRQQYGPVPAEQLRRWLAENRVNGQTQARLEGTQEWKPLSAFAEFSADFTTPPPLTGTPPPLVAAAAPPPNPVAAKAANKIPAGILGILLGSLGIHKFILGYTAPGVIMLAVTVVTCGFGGVVMHIIGIIEGILYLTKTDEEFVRTYVDGRREWF